MREFITTALSFLPFYILYVLIGTIGYVNWYLTGSADPEDWYRMIFGYLLLGGTFTVTLFRIYLGWRKQPCDYQYTILMVIITSLILVPVGFFLCAASYGNMFNFDDYMYQDGVISTYAIVFLIGAIITIDICQRDEIGVVVGFLIAFGVISVSCLIFGYHNDNQETLVCGFIFLGGTVIDGILLLITLYCRTWVFNYSRV